MLLIKLVRPNRKPSAPPFFGPISSEAIMTGIWMIVANSLRVEGAGFGGDTNVVTMITEEEEISLGKMSKEETASHILDQIMKMRQSRENRN